MSDIRVGAKLIVMNICHVLGVPVEVSWDQSPITSEESQLCADDGQPFLPTEDFESLHIARLY